MKITITSASISTSPFWFAVRTSLAVLLVACGGPARLSDLATVGERPVIVKPDKSLIPIMNVAEARAWRGNAMPIAAPGLEVHAFARGLQHPRWLHVLPNGDVLVAESNAPPKPEGAKNKNTSGIRGWFFKRMVKKAGAAVPSANRITLLRDTDGDGIAERRTTFLRDLVSPFGMTLVGNTMYIANADALVRVPYTAGDTIASAQPTKVVDLPAGANHHWTKNVIANAHGTLLYVTVGSNSNAGENGMASEEGRAAIWEIDPARNTHRIFASGLRNPNGLAWEPATSVLWTVVNERDNLGSDLVPDYLTSVRDGAFYGWPYSYFGQHVDTRPEPPRPDLVARAIVPDYALGSHVAPLGLVYVATSPALPPQYAGGMFIGLHGSWNREPMSGYKVVFVPFKDGKPNGAPVDVLGGFVQDKIAFGRPVGVAMDGRGALIVADDVGNTIWRVTGRSK